MLSSDVITPPVHFKDSSFSALERSWIFKSFLRLNFLSLSSKAKKFDWEFWMVDLMVANWGFIAGYFGDIPRHLPPSTIVLPKPNAR